MDTTCGLRITAAAGTYITLHLFAKPFKLCKSLQRKHSKSPYHAFAHCKGFAPAAPRRARTLISVSFSGLSLSRPVRIFGLVGIYPANNLIRRRPIFWRKTFCMKKALLNKNSFQMFLSMAHYAQFPGFDASKR